MSPSRFFTVSNLDGRFESYDAAWMAWAAAGYPGRAGGRGDSAWITEHKIVGGCAETVRTFTLTLNPAAKPTPFGSARAEVMWSTRGLQNTIRDIEPGEDAYVKAVWSTMPGNTCWMDAFHRIRTGTVLA